MAAALLSLYIPAVFRVFFFFLTYTKISITALLTLRGNGYAKGRREAFAMTPGSLGRVEDPGPGGRNPAMCDQHCADSTRASVPVRRDSQVFGSLSSQFASSLLSIRYPCQKKKKEKFPKGCMPKWFPKASCYVSCALQLVKSLHFTDLPDLLSILLLPNSLPLRRFPVIPELECAGFV